MVNENIHKHTWTVWGAHCVDFVYDQALGFEGGMLL